jgi:CDP-6-deoxy-D-xylo-4-hexulose-3-dehydrase
MWRGRYLNEYYIAYSNSFYPAHHISTGEGGMVCTDDDELKSLLTSIAWWGRDCYCVGSTNLLPNGSCGCRFNKWMENYDGIIDHKYYFTNVGYNLKPLDLQGAIGIEQLAKFGEIDEKRKYAKNRIENIVVSKIDGIVGIDSFFKADTCWFGTPFICETKELKNRIVTHLETNKIQTRNYFAGNILLHPAYSYLDDFSLYPEANKVLDKVFFIGCSPHYTDDVFDYIAQIIDKFDQ